jgi:hypothetical protein
MNTYYGDILSRIPEPPLWWDEVAVPRFCEFSPQEVANIYASYAVLALVTCQGCGTEYRVAFSQGSMDRYLGRDEAGEIRWAPTLDEAVLEKGLHYGDPPNGNCCCAGPTMNSEPRRVLEFWKRAGGMEWERDAAFEVDIEPEWVRA